MGVYINMEMPKNCPSCPFNSRAWYEDSHLCLASNKQIKVNLNTGFDDNCPLVPVPPHGRLIDADDFIKRMEGLVHQAEADGYDLGAAWYTALIRHIELAPTVIPAEEGE